MGLLIDEVNKCEAEIEKNAQEKLELSRKIEELNQKNSELKIKEKQSVVFVYHDPNDRKELIENIKVIGMDKSKIDLIENGFNDLRIDKVDDDFFNLIIEAEKLVDDYSSYTNQKENATKKSFSKIIIEFFRDESEGYK